MGRKHVHMCPGGCISVCVLGVGNVASCNTTHSRVSPISTSQSVLKRIRAADFSLSAAAGLFRKTNAERVCVCVCMCRTRGLCLIIWCEQLSDKSTGFLSDISSILFCSFSVFLLSASLSIVGFGDLLCFSLPVEKMGRVV